MNAHAYLLVVLLLALFLLPITIGVQHPHELDRVAYTLLLLLLLALLLQVLAYMPVSKEGGSRMHEPVEMIRARGSAKACCVRERGRERERERERARLLKRLLRAVRVEDLLPDTDIPRRH